MHSEMVVSDVNYNHIESDRLTVQSHLKYRPLRFTATG